MEVVASREGWRLIDEMLASESDDWRRQMLSQLREHMRAECGGELDRLLATLVDDPQFHNWDKDVDQGPKGAEALREFYTGLIASGANRFEYHLERIVIGDDTLVTEGRIRVPFAGSVLKSMGMDVKEDAVYATRGRAVTFWPFAPDGRIIGEDIYNMTTDLGEAEEVELKPYTYGED